MNDLTACERLPAAARSPVLKTVLTAALAVERADDAAHGAAHLAAGADPEDRYEAVRGFARCAALVGPGDERARFAARARGVLRELAASGFPPEERLRRDSDLDPLRGGSAFEALIAPRNAGRDAESQ